MAKLNAVQLTRRLTPILAGLHVDTVNFRDCLTQCRTENLASPLDWCCMGHVHVKICINALVDHKVVVMPADPELVIGVVIFNCPNAIMEIFDWYKVCIIFLSNLYVIPML